MFTTPSRLFRPLVLCSVMLLAACGDGNDSQSQATTPVDPPPVTNPSHPPGTPTYSVGGTVSGLAGSGLVLQNNAGDDLTISADGNFAFATQLASGDTYAVTIKTQPGSPTQTCTVGNGSGTMGTAAVTNVAVNCVSSHFAFVNGLAKTSVFRVDDATGALTDTGHSIPLGGILPTVISPNGKYIYQSDITIDSVRGYAVDPLSGALTELAGSPYATGGDEPQAMAIAPDGEHLYVANRNSDNLTVFSIGATGALTPVGTPVSTGDNPMFVSPTADGKFVYVANRSAASVSIYSVNATTGALTLVGQPLMPLNPRYMAIDANSKFLYMTSGTDNRLYGFAINSTTGALSAMPGSPFTAGNGAQNIAINPTGQFLYVTNETDGTVSAFTINVVSGALTSAGPDLSTGGLPEGVAVAPSGKYVYVASQTAHAVVSFEVNTSTGGLSAGLTNPWSSTPLDIAILGQ